MRSQEYLIIGSMIAFALAAVAMSFYNFASCKAENPGNTTLCYAVFAR